MNSIFDDWRRRLWRATAKKLTTPIVRRSGVMLAGVMAAMPFFAPLAHAETTEQLNQQELGRLQSIYGVQQGAPVSSAPRTFARNVQTVVSNRLSFTEQEKLEEYKKYYEDSIAYYKPRGYDVTAITGYLKTVNDRLNQAPAIASPYPNQNITDVIHAPVNLLDPNAVAPRVPPSPTVAPAPAPQGMVSGAPAAYQTANSPRIAAAIDHAYQRAGEYGQHYGHDCFGEVSDFFDILGVRLMSHNIEGSGFVPIPNGGPYPKLTLLYFPPGAGRKGHYEVNIGNETNPQWFSGPIQWSTEEHESIFPNKTYARYGVFQAYQLSPAIMAQLTGTPVTAVAANAPTSQPTPLPVAVSYAQPAPAVSSAATVNLTTSVQASLPQQTSLRPDFSVDGVDFYRNPVASVSVSSEEDINRLLAQANPNASATQIASDYGKVYGGALRNIQAETVGKVTFNADSVREVIHFGVAQQYLDELHLTLDEGIEKARKYAPEKLPILEAMKAAQQRSAQLQQPPQEYSAPQEYRPLNRVAADIRHARKHLASIGKGKRGAASARKRLSELQDEHRATKLAMQAGAEVVVRMKLPAKFPQQNPQLADFRPVGFRAPLALAA